MIRRPASLAMARVALLTADSTTVSRRLLLAPPPPFNASPILPKMLPKPPDSLGVVGMGFQFNRLETVARALPVLARDFGPGVTPGVANPAMPKA